MRMLAKVTCVYGDDSSSRAVASALRPDNFQAPKSIKVQTMQKGKCVITNVELDGKIETLLATLDDLLSCTSTAESVL